jgi:class 3 adenylate cyclase
VTRTRTIASISTRVLTVGFADLCGFTQLSRTLDDEQLVELLDEFEATCETVVDGRGGHLVKHLGDGALFTAESAEAGAAIAIELVRESLENRAMPALRVGLSRGRVLLRRDDCFGTVVNRAKRIVDVAPPCSVVVDRSARPETLPSNALGVIDLRDFDPGPLWSVQISNAGQTASLASTAASRLAL